MSQDIEERRQAIAARNYEQGMWDAFQGANQGLTALRNHRRNARSRRRGAEAETAQVLMNGFGKAIQPRRFWKPWRAAILTTV